MCTQPKIHTVSSDDEEKEVIKNATQADASLQKANVQNRAGVSGIVNPNIKTSNIGVDDEIQASKKKLLGE